MYPGDRPVPRRAPASLACADLARSGVAVAIALSVLLLALTLAVNALFTSVQQRKR